MKKLAKLFVVIFVLALLALTLVACNNKCADGNHKLQKVDATATCTEPGNMAYWKCSECGKLFKDAEGTEQISVADLPTEALDHDWQLKSDTATCLAAGKKNYECSRCHETKQEDSAQLLHSFLKSDGSVDTSKLVAAVSASCEKGGNMAYYLCENCKHYFTAEGNTLTDKGTDITAVQIPATGHTFQKADGSLDASKLVAATDSTCQTKGNIAYYLCGTCNHYYDSTAKDLGTEKSAVEKPIADHDWTAWAHDEQNPGNHKRTCQTTGCTETQSEQCAAATGASWSKDDTGHWHLCAVCQAKIDFGAHAEDALNCETCGWVSAKAVVTLTISGKTTYYASVEDLSADIEKMVEDADEEAQLSAIITLLKDTSGEYIGVPMDVNNMSVGGIGGINLTIDLGGHTLTLDTGVLFADGIHTLQNGTLAISENSDTTDSQEPSVAIAVWNVGATLNLKNIKIQAETVALVVMAGETTINSGVELTAEAALEIVYSGEEIALNVTSGANPTVTGMVLFGYVGEEPSEGWLDEVVIVLGTLEKTLPQIELLKMDHGMIIYNSYQDFVDALLTDHVHEAIEGKWVEDGDPNYHFGVCLCGEIIPDIKQDHSWEKAPADHEGNKDATCTEEGIEIWVCNVCKQEKEKAIDKIAHNFQDAPEHSGNVAPTCDHVGTKIQLCSECNAINEVELPKVAHSNITASVCGVCKNTLTDDEVIEMLLALTDQRPASPDSNNNSVTLEGTFKLTGTIISVVTDYNPDYGNITVDINVNGTTIQAFRMKNGTASGIANLVAGDTITVLGTLKHYYTSGKWVLEFDTGCTLEELTKVQLDITWTYDSSEATVTLADDTTSLPTTLEGGSSISFKASAISADKKIGSVTANDTVINAVAGVYTVVIKANTVIVITVVDADSAVPEELVVLDFNESDVREAAVGSGGYQPTQSFTINWNDYQWSFTGFNNNSWNNSWTYIKAMGSSAAYTTATITSTFAEQITSIVLVAKLNNGGYPAKVKLEVIKGEQVIYIAEKSVTSTDKETITLDVKAFESDCTYKLTFTAETSGSNGNLWLYSITYNAIDCNHAWGEMTTGVAANCTYTGTMVQTCSKCSLVKETIVPSNDIHSFMNADKEATGNPAKAETAPGENELGNPAIYLCEHCNHYFVLVGDEWQDLGDDFDAAIAQVRIHNDSHNEHIHYASDDEGHHTLTCDKCAYTLTESCNANGNNNSCDKCGYTDNSATFVEANISYIVGSASATTDTPANIVITWYNSAKESIVAPSQLKCGDTYYITINLNGKYTLTSVQIGDQHNNEEDGYYIVAVEANATEPIAIIITVEKVPEVVHTLDTTGSTQTDNNGYAKTGSVVVDGITWNLEGNGQMNPWRLGGSSLTGVDRAAYTSTALKAKVTKIDITFGTVSGLTVNSLKVIVARDSGFSDVVSTLTPTFVASSTVTVEANGADWSNCYYKIIVNVTTSGSGNKYVQLSKVVFTGITL